MEIGNKILELRKKKGLSQEELAEKIGVARQTISKWELGETSPDLKQSKELSKILHVSLDELADNDMKDVIVERKLHIDILFHYLKYVVVVIIVFFLLLVIAKITIKSYRKNYSGRLMNISIECILHDEKYFYEFRYYEDTGKITEAGGDGYLSNIINLDQYDDAYQSLDIIDAYVKNNGGTCTRTEPKIAKDY